MPEWEMYQNSEDLNEVRESQALIVRLLNRRVGNVSTEMQARVNILPLTRLEDLGEALLNFTQMGDLLTWLDENM
jgi:Domain of unknown function (DUF4351)